MQILLQSEANVITKWGSFFVLQSGAKTITKKGMYYRYYKAGPLLLADVTKWGKYYK